MTMPNASEPVCLAFVIMLMVIVTCQLQSIKATLPVDAALSLRHPSMRGTRRTSHETGDPITRHYFLYPACSSRIVRIYGGKIDARGEQDSVYIQLKATTDSFDRIRIQSSMTGDFVCFNRHARLVVRARGSDAGCYFKETMTDGHFNEFQSAYNTSWYIGFNQRGKALRGSHWKTHKVNQKAIKCRKFTKKELIPEQKIKEATHVGIKVPGRSENRVKLASEREIKGSGKRKKIGNAKRQIEGTAEQRIRDTEGSAQYKTG